MNQFQFQDSPETQKSIGGRPVLTRAEFDQLDIYKKGEHIRAGGLVVDAPTGAKDAESTEDSAGGRLENGRPVLTRAEFGSLSPHYKMEHIRAGGLVVDTLPSMAAPAGGEAAQNGVTE